MKLIIRLLFLALSLSACAAIGPRVSPSTSNQTNLVGTWRSTEIGGTDIGNRLQMIEYTFTDNGTFSVFGKMSDGTEQKYVGTYSQSPSTFQMIIKGKGTQRQPYTIIDGVLTIHDERLDSWVRYKRLLGAELPLR